MPPRSSVRAGLQAWVLLSLWAAAAGCGDAPAVCGEPCTSDGDCRENLSCFTTDDGPVCLPDGCKACASSCSYRMEDTMAYCEFVSCGAYSGSPGGGGSEGTGETLCGASCSGDSDCGEDLSCFSDRDQGMICAPSGCQACKEVCLFTFDAQWQYCGFAGCDPEQGG